MSNTNRRQPGVAPRWHEQIRHSLSPATSRWSGRRRGRRWRLWRRLLSVSFLICAAVAATWETPLPVEGQVITVADDLPTGTVLAESDLVLVTLAWAPGGVLRSRAEAIGQVLVSPIRRGEILTDVRLVSRDGPSAGPGRKAVAVRPADPAMAGILTPGVRVAVIGVDSTGAAVILTADAIVLNLPAAAADSAALPGTFASPVLLAVRVQDVDLVTAATLSGDIALRFS